MKTLTAFLAPVLFLGVVSSVALAQSGANAQLPNQPSAVLVGTVEVPVLLEAATAGKKKGSLVSEITIWRTETADGGRAIQFLIATPSISYEGDAEAIDATPTPELYARLSRAAVEEAIRIGMLTAAHGTTTKVWAESSVVRTGTGNATGFAPNGSSMQARDFTLAWTDSGSATVHQTSAGVFPIDAGSTLD